MKTSRRGFFGIIGSAATATLVAACGSGEGPTPIPPTAAPLAAVVPPAAPAPTSTAVPQPTPAPTEAPTVAAQVNPTATVAARHVRMATWTIRVHSRGAPFAALDLLNAAQKLPPERAVTVDFVRVDTQAPSASQIAAQYAAALASGATEADLVFADHTTLRALANAKVLRDLGSILDKEPWFKKDDFWTNILQAGQVRGVQLSLPMDASVEVLAYNPTSVQRQGIELPTTWSWEQLTAIAKKLTSDGKWGLSVSAWSPSIFSLAWQHGAQLIGSGGNLRVDEPGTIAALGLLQELLQTAQVSPPLDRDHPLAAGNDPFAEEVLDAPYPPDVAALVRGSVAMLARLSSIPSFGAWWHYVKNFGYDIGVAPLPQAGSPSTFGAVFSMLGIPTNAPNPDASLAALHALLDVTDVAGYLPPRKTVKNLRQVAKTLTEQDASVLSASLPFARFLPGDVSSDVFQLVANDLVLPVLLGKKKPSDAARDAQKLIDAAMTA